MRRCIKGEVVRNPFSSQNLVNFACIWTCDPTNMERPLYHCATPRFPWSTIHIYELNSSRVQFNSFQTRIEFLCEVLHLICDGCAQNVAVRILNSVRPRGIRSAGARGSVPAGLAGRGGGTRGGVIDLRTTCTATYRKPDAPIDFPVWGGSADPRAGRVDDERDPLGRGKGTELHLCGGIANAPAGSLGKLKFPLENKNIRRVRSVVASAFMTIKEI